MKQILFTTCLRLCFMLPLLPWFTFRATAQQIVVDLAPIDGMAINPDNVFNYQVQSPKSVSVQVRGTIRYRNSGLSLSYSFNCQLHQGINVFNTGGINPQWQFSSPALRELFFTYKMLPEGTYEYCVSVIPAVVLPENGTGAFDECLYHRAGDLFLINLVDPENEAKQKDFNPPLSWIANYSFSNELTYRIRVAEIREGQNPVNAVMRNQPVYDEKNLMQNSIVYPVYAKPLEANKPYAWTVDAYYKGILLGGSETWKFIIPDDTLLTAKKVTRSYIDIKREAGINKLSALGIFNLKYVLDDARKDELYLEIVDVDDKKIDVKPSKLKAAYGDNRYTLNLADSCHLKHRQYYNMNIGTKTGHNYRLFFQYLNPDFQN
jgi:hypothetical protein